MNTDQLHADTRSCGELSCEECNERTEALRNEIARLTSELSTLQTECDHLRITRAEFKRKVSDVEAENAALREERDDERRRCSEWSAMNDLLRTEVEVWKGKYWSALAADVKPPLGSPEDLHPPQEP